MSSACPGRVRITCRWPATTTSCRGPPSSSSKTAPPDWCGVGKPTPTCWRPTLLDAVEVARGWLALVVAQPELRHGRARLLRRRILDPRREVVHGVVRHGAAGDGAALRDGRNVAAGAKIRADVARGARG